MKKKMYKKPSMRMVVIKQTIALLAGSPGASQLPEFENGGDPLSN